MVKLLVIVALFFLFCYGVVVVSHLPGLYRRYLTREGRHRAKIERYDRELDQLTATENEIRRRSNE